MNSQHARHASHSPSHLPQFLILGGLILLVAVVLVIKQEKTLPRSPLTAAPVSPEQRLDTALRAELPTLAFFHSYTCEQCLVMIDTVSQVFPSFADDIVLIDVDVYDEANTPLLERVSLHYIPTLIFYDRAGKAQVSVGVMEGEQLRQTLTALAAGN